MVVRVSEDGRAQRFTAVYRQCYPAVLAYARRRAEEQVARDVAAEVFLVAWRRLPEVPEAPLPWLLGTARFVLANASRGQRRAELHLARSISMQPPPPAPDHADAVAERHRVLAALRQLAPADRELLLLTAWEGLDVAAAAGVVGCSPATARVRLHRARRRLRTHLETRQHRSPAPASSPAQPAWQTEVL
jgi:RNA polymerase sigma-70 factor (ECF subfamily)